MCKLFKLKHKLKKIANIQTGIFAKPSGKGEIVYLQAKHFNELGQLSSLLYPDLKAESISEKHLLKAGDIVFAAKGSKNFAAVYEAHNVLAVASTSFFVIRLFEQEILPAYLAWILNSSPILSQLKENALGTSIPSISKQVLAELSLPIPGIDQQKKIIQITVLRKRETELVQKIQSLREIQIQTQLFNSINN